MKKDRSYYAPVLSVIRRLGAYDDNNTRLVDEVQGVYDLGSTRFELYLAPHTGVLARAAANGIDVPRWQLRELLG